MGSAADAPSDSAALLDGCVSVGINRSKGDGQNRGVATLEVRIYETPSDLRRGALTSRIIVSEMVRTDVSPEQRIYRGVDPTWTRSDLSPGRYRLTAVAVLDETAAEKPLPNQDSERFRLHAGESVRATILLKRAPIGAIAGVSAGVDSDTWVPRIAFFKKRSHERCERFLMVMPVVALVLVRGRGLSPESWGV